MKYCITLLLIISACLSIDARQKKTASSQSYHLLIGTYTKGKSKGIYVYKFNAGKGDFTYESEVKVTNPSYLAISPDKKVVYAVTSENDTSKVGAFRFESKTGALTYLNSQPSGGLGPCYVSIDRKRQHVFVANYAGGTLSSIPVSPNGSLGLPLQTIAHTGNSVNTQRQEKPHIHAAMLSPDEKFLLAPDLGIDKVMIYPLTSSIEKPLDVDHSGFASIEAGGGPRHLDFHPNGKYVYVIHELTAKVTAFRYHAGKLTHIQTVSLVADDFKGGVSAADIHVSSDGKFLYASNRGDANEIIIFSIAKSGLLTFAGRESTRGKIPRNFTLDPTGKFLLVANQESDSVILFARDEKTGLLHYTGQSIDVGNPTCLKFIPIE